jgi:hypothetical protein
MDTAGLDRRPEANGGERLDSWKEIAAYLNRSVRTLHRWEKDEGLPVHRQLHKDLGSVFAYKSELDAWSRARSTRAELEEQRASASRTVLIAALTLASAAFVIAAIYYVAVGRSNAGAPHAPPVASLELLKDLKSGLQQTLVEQRMPLVSPAAFSPDGRRIAFQAKNSRGDMQLVVMNANGSNQMAVTNGSGQLNIMPQWSGDGDSLYPARVVAGAAALTWVAFRNG